VRLYCHGCHGKKIEKTDFLLRDVTMSRLYCHDVTVKIWKFWVFSFSEFKNRRKLNLLRFLKLGKKIIGECGKMRHRCNWLAW